MYAQCVMCMCVQVRNVYVRLCVCVCVWLFSGGNSIYLGWNHFKYKDVYDLYGILEQQ